MTINEAEAQERHALDAADATTEPAAAEASSTSTADQPDEVHAATSADGVKSTRRPKSVSVSLRGLILGAGIAALVVATAVLGWLYSDARHQLSAQATQSANNARAEKIALDYAVNAATMDYKDLQGWKVKLTAGTSQELSKKLSDAGTSIEQVLVPLQWSSSARPLVAKVRSTNGGIYVVDSFVSVQTKTVQAPDALQSTATYSTTIDSNNGWQITDVGGIGSAMGPK
jgi:Mce-associated membrane protein